MLWVAIVVALLWLGIALDVVGRSLARPCGSEIRHEDEKNASGTAIFDAGRIGSAAVAVGLSFGGTRRMMPNPALTDSFASHYQSWR